MEKRGIRCFFIKRKSQFGTSFDFSCNVAAEVPIDIGPLFGRLWKITLNSLHFCGEPFRFLLLKSGLDIESNELKQTSHGFENFLNISNS